VLLGEIPEREIVLGTIGQVWRPAGGRVPGIGSASAFLAFDLPGSAKAMMNFQVEPIDDGEATKVAGAARVDDLWRSSPGTGASSLPAALPAMPSFSACGCARSNSGPSSWRRLDMRHG
jgi:hypothetical protein